MSLKGNVAMITGASSGIGKATALLFAENGARSVICGRDRKSLYEISKAILRLGADCIALKVDVRDWLQVKAITDVAIEQYGRIDILINNAGIALAKPLIETTEEDWNSIINTNMKGVFLCCKAVLPTMMAMRQGTIINISSTLGIQGTSKMAAYSASKFGVIGLTQSLAAEVKLPGIKVYAVCPGSTNTNLHRRIVGDEAAKVAMSPFSVAERIYGIVTGDIHLHSGGVFVVDNHKKEFPLRANKQTLLTIIKNCLIFYMSSVKRL